MKKKNLACCVRKWSKMSQTCSQGPPCIRNMQYHVKLNVPRMTHEKYLPNLTLDKQF